MTALIYTSAAQLADWGPYHDDVGDGWWVVMVIAMALFWAAVIGAIFSLARSAVHSLRSHPHGATPLEVLQHRFARGEITAEEYERMRGVLERSPVPPPE